MSLPNSKKSANLLLSVFTILILLFCMGGNVLYRYQKKSITKEKHDELAAINRLKVDQIVNWRKERLANARNIFNNQSAIILINEYIHGINKDANYLIIKNYFKSILQETDFSTAFLIDPSGKVIINMNPADPLSETGKQHLAQAKQHKDIIFSDLLIDNNKHICINLAIPLYLNPEKREGFSGMIMLRIDPAKNFYPLILSWPIASRTSEISLFRREGNNVLFLSELRHKKNSALRLLNPLSDTNSLASQAVSGKSGILEGIDYRGVKVLGETQAVPGSPWYIVTKIDFDEIYYPITMLAIWIFVITFLLILITAFVIYVFWKRQLNKSELERKALLQHFNFVVKYANDIICLADLKGNIYEANDKAVNTYGYTYDELLKLNFSHLRPAENKDTFDQQLNLLNESNGSIYETIHINKNGDKFPVEVSGIIMVIYGVKYIQVIIRDITDRKEAEKTLQVANLYHRSLLEASLDSLVTIGSDGKITDVNAATEHITGIQRDKLIGTDFSDYFTDPEKARSGYQKVFREGAVHDYPLEIQHPDGHLISVLYNASLYKDEKGQVVGAFAAARDITERNLALEKLRASEEGLRTLSESVPLFVWIAQPDGMLIYFNHQWTEYTGLTLEESYGTGWSTPFHPDDKQIALDSWKYATETGGKYDLECRLRQYNGEYHWFVIKGVSLRDNSGAVIKWYGTCTDIDNQKQAEKEIKKLNEDLEHRVDERTFQLQSANKELEAFAYSVSHDLRAPLRSIDGWSMALLEDCYDQLDEQGRQYLDRVRNETHRMGFLIDDLLKLSRVSLTELRKVNVDLTLLAQTITARLLKTPTDRQFEFIIQPGMTTVGDQNMLEIALTNLLDNAYKFTSRQPIAKIEFGRSIINEKPTYWVHDNGVGFDMSYSKNLFGAFQRFHKQSEFPGTGIGLATVQRIIHRHDGLIWAESHVNQGTTFLFTLLE